MRRHRVVVLVLDGAQPLDVGIPAQTFQARDELPYDVLMCGVEPGPVRSGEGMSYLVEHGLEALERADTVIVPGYREPTRAVDPRALDALRAAHARGARIAAICTGVFAVAAAGRRPSASGAGRRRSSCGRTLPPRRARAPPGG